LSYFANIYARKISGLPIMDCTGGFKCFRREVLEGINLDKIKSDGYAFQIEMNYYVWRAGFRIGEFSIVFVDRVEGDSKMNKNIILEAILLVWKLRWKTFLSIFRKQK
jgi:dolichol-phosphate mannosyltransferase